MELAPFATALTRLAVQPSRVGYFVTEVENAASRRDTASLARRTASSDWLPAASACAAACAAWLADASAAFADASALFASAWARSVALLIVFMSGPHAVTSAVTATTPSTFRVVFMRTLSSSGSGQTASPATQSDGSKNAGRDE